MKNWMQYLKLWQQKRSEMRIGDEAEEDWQGMRSLLDEHMPVDGGTAKKRGISLLSTMLITLSAAAMLYVGVKVVQKRIQQQQQKNHLLHHRHKVAGTGIDTTASADSAITLEDSIYNKTHLSDTIGDIKIPDTKKSEQNNPNESITAKSNTAVAQKGITATLPRNATDHDHIPGRHIDDLPTHTAVNAQTLASDGNSGSNHGLNVINDVKGKWANTTKNVDKAGSTGRIDSPENQIALLEQPRQSFNTGIWNISSPIDFKPIVLQRPPMPGAKTPKDKKQSNKAKKTASNSPVEWGVLVGANTQGSFTPKSQNTNFYGSLPVDAFAGIYGTYDVNENWGVGLQARVLSPAIIKGRYAKSTSTQRIDTINVVTTKYFNDARKVYSVQLPLYATYHANSNLSFKAGPVFSLPVKQYYTAVIDSASRPILTGSRYDKKLDIGLSGGVSLRYKRLIFEASYLKGLTNHTLSTDSLSYKAHTSGTLQFTIGIQLGGKKK